MLLKKIQNRGWGILNPSSPHQIKTLIDTVLGNILTELPLPVAVIASDLKVEITYQKLKEIQQKSTELGTWLPDMHLTSTALTTGSIPFFRICEAGLIDIREGKLVDLVV